MRKSHLSFKSRMLVIPLLLLCTQTVRAQHAVVTDSGIVIFRARATQSTIATYDKLLANPRLLYEGGQRVVGFEVSIIEKGKDYAGPFKSNGNRFSDQTIAYIRHMRAVKAANDRMFIEQINIQNGDSIKYVGTVAITMIP